MGKLDEQPLLCLLPLSVKSGKVVISGWASQINAGAAGPVGVPQWAI